MIHDLEHFLGLALSPNTHVVIKFCFGLRTLLQLTLTLQPFLFWISLQRFPCFLVRFSFVFQGFSGFSGDDNPCFFHTYTGRRVKQVRFGKLAFLQLNGAIFYPKNVDLWPFRTTFSANGRAGVETVRFSRFWGISGG